MSDLMKYAFTGLDALKGFGHLFVSLSIWLGKRFFTKEKLSEKVVLGACAHNRALSINCWDNPSITVWMNIRNYTPFDQKLDNLTAIYYQSGVKVKLRPDQKQTV